MNEISKKYGSTSVELTSDNIVHYIGGKDIGNSISTNFDSIISKSTIQNDYNKVYGYGYDDPITFNPNIFPNGYKYPKASSYLNEPKKYQSDDKHLTIVRRKLNFKY